MASKGGKKTKGLTGQPKFMSAKQANQMLTAASEWRTASGQFPPSLQDRIARAREVVRR